MGSVSRDVSGTWRARWRDTRGRSRSRNFDRKVDAERFLTSVDHAKLTGSYVDPAAGRVLFRSWVAEWRTCLVDLRPSTKARDDGYVDRYILPAFGDTRLAEIDHATVQAWVSDLATRGLAPSTVTLAAGLLRKIMAGAVKAGKIPSSPCVGVRLPRIEREEMRFLDARQVAALAERIDPRFRALVYLGAYGGLRIGEMLGLRSRRIDVVRRRVDVSEILVEVEGELYAGPPKTRAGRRSVPLPRVASEALRDHLRAWPAEPDDLVFRAPECGPVRLSTWRRRFWSPAVTAAGLAPLRPHDLRHTAVALWIAAGASPKELAARAGHSSVSFTLDRYGHLLPGSEDRVNEALDELAAQGDPGHIWDPGRLL